MQRPARAPAQGLVQVISGAVAVREPSGALQVFRAGQAVFIPAGTAHALATSEGVSACRVTLRPAASGPLPPGPA